jgi:predicted ATPase
MQGTLADEGMGIPENLRQLIERQLTRVTPDERKILEAASVVGAEFSAAAVAAGAEQSAEAAEVQCEALVRREQFLHARGRSEWPDGTMAARYGFVHALYQEVLYEQISTSQRARLHRQIGEREEQAYGERAREIAAELAVHFEQGRDYRKAVQYLQQAGENAVRRSAHQEAIFLLTKGLELLKTQPYTPERMQQELALLTTLGPALITTRGYAAPEVEQVYTQARTLVQQLGDTPQEFFVLNGLWNNYEVQGKHQISCELGEQLLNLAQRRQDPALLILAHHALTVTLFYLEDLPSALAHVDQALALYDRQHYSLTFFHGHDPRVSCLLFAGHILWSLGYPDQALARNREAVAWAQELAHPYSLAYALTNTAWRHQLRREAKAAQEHADAAVALCREHGFPLMEAQGTIWLGWALAEQGQLEEGIEKIRWGLDAWRATRAELAWPYFLTLLAEAYRKVGRVEDGLAVVAEGLATAHRNDERWYEAELYRLQGELLLKSEDNHSRSIFGNLQSEAEECFQKAINIAHHRNAKSLELRAAVSLARMWQQQGKQQEAHKMLFEIYHWFTEGFDTKDLQEAKALLEELNH